MTAAILATLLLAASTETAERFEGLARRGDGQVAYREIHEVRFQDGRVSRAETRYADDAGRVFAELVSDYSRHPFVPTYEFRDHRTGTREAVQHQDGGLALQDGDRVRVMEPPRERPVVAGQGLDRYTRAHLQRLSRGETLLVELALPGRLDSYAFRIRAEPLATGALRVRFEPDSFLLRMLAPAIEADYDPSSGRLLRYRGVSNVAGPDGEPQNVEIVYSYLELASR